MRWCEYKYPNKIFYRRKKNLHKLYMYMVHKTMYSAEKNIFFAPNQPGSSVQSVLDLEVTSWWLDGFSGFSSRKRNSCCFLTIVMHPGLKAGKRKKKTQLQTIKLPLMINISPWELHLPAFIARCHCCGWNDTHLDASIQVAPDPTGV